MTEKLHSFDGPGIRITWSGRRCIHVAECVRGLPGVFRPGERPWIHAERADAATLARIVERCPSGALHYERADGGPAEAVPARNEIRPRRNGPLFVRGDLEIAEADGTVMLRDVRVALCRCGQSENKPFCDNHHLAADFRDAGDVFEGGVKPGEPGLNPAEPGTERRLRILVSENGPYRLTGPLVVTSADGRVTLTGGAASLCRCGGSRNKPFCDGSHTRVEFQAG